MKVKNTKTFLKIKKKTLKSTIFAAEGGKRREM